MSEIDEYEATQEDGTADQMTETPDEPPQTEELLPMLHYMSSVLNQLKEAATALQAEHEKLLAYGANLKKITAVLSSEANHLQEAQTATLQNVENGCRAMFALTAKNFEHMSMEAQKWQKSLLHKQTNRFEMIGMVAYIIPILVILDILVHIYVR